MKKMPKEAFRYAILLIALFAIATLTVRSILLFLEERLAPEHFYVVNILMFSLTLGFMMIAGAFGLWAVRFSAEGESRRRIGRFVDAMDYLSDGLVTLDDKGRITGSNPAASVMAERESLNALSLRDVFDGLSEADADALVRERKPHECECKPKTGMGGKVYRFRSQPSEGLTLVMISDVTTMNEQIARNRQAARLQLIGQIARGVAHDFNELLCAVSGQASLLRHLPRDSEETQAGIEHILRDADKGIALATHLRDLAQPVRTAAPTEVCHEYLAMAVDRIRDSLSDDVWTVETDLRPVAPVSFTGLQIEQIVVNLALLCADAMSRGGILKVEIRPPQPDYPFDLDGVFAGVILVSVRGRASAASSGARMTVESDTTESGVILSVIRSMIEDAGGAFDVLRSGQGLPMYRVGLPYGTFSPATGTIARDIREFEAYMAQWSVLLALAPGRQRFEPLKDRLKACRADVLEVDNIMSVLAHVDKDVALDAVIADRTLLGREMESLLKAVLKLRPSAGVVVLTEQAGAEFKTLAGDVVFAEAHADPDSLLMALVEAKGQAVRRSKA